MTWYAPFLFKLRETIFSLFSPRYLPWHVLAIVLTYVFVITDTDWNYYEISRNPFIQMYAWPAGILGFFAPLIIPALLLIRGGAYRVMGYAVIQAQAIGWLLSAFYKTFTGRAHPPLQGITLPTDITHVFQFGLLKAGVFWGWPSSHATVACAFSATVFLLSDKLWVRVLAIVYATYVTVGASLTFHWFSDAVAGVIFGTLVGVLVARAFKTYTKAS